MKRINNFDDALFNPAIWTKPFGLPLQNYERRLNRLAKSVVRTAIRAALVDLMTDMVNIEQKGDISLATQISVPLAADTGAETDVSFNTQATAPIVESSERPTDPKYPPFKAFILPYADSDAKSSKQAHAETDVSPTCEPLCPPKDTPPNKIKNWVSAPAPHYYLQFAVIFPTKEMSLILLNGCYHSEPTVSLITNHNIIAQ